ncbi:glycoside hydrolase [Pedobacter psychrophilus]|uniref:Glycoside hydrolase n=2 Tax=Pedobacter psychrophilus TaxID=1826909 RepID=A0A179DHQ6_9SPHI|nr:glycoside hydrolase [Pedobacter psychrophilus]
MGNRKNKKMKIVYNLIGVLMLSLSLGCMAQEFKNPIDVKLGDPYVLKTAQGKYYMYGTGGVKNGFKCYSSTDLVNWKDEGVIYTNKQEKAWGISAFWAPEVYEKDNNFYLFYSAQWKENPTNELENFKIGVAVSKSPTGPFIDVSGKPIFNPDYPIIDGNVFFENNKVYLYYSRCCYKHPVESEVATWAKEKGWYKEIEESWVYGVELKKDFSGIIGEPVLLLKPPVKQNKETEWESRSVTSHEANRRWTEGSTLLKNNATYYMTYSANNFDGENYAVGYATSKNPLGPFTKSVNNPILQKKGDVTGTGHNSITWSPDGKEMLCVYHGRTKESGHQRVVFIDRMHFDDSGNLIVNGPTTNLQKYPSK